MVREDFKGDFTGFSFGGIHSSELGIVRVSSGDRYNENLQPEIKDITAEVSGRNGLYYFGSDYGSKIFDIEFAFDSLTEEQFRKLRAVFGTKEIKQLIFDEWPYKYYLAKLENPIELSYVCFDERKKIIDKERNGVRILERIYATSVIGQAVVGQSHTDDPNPQLTRIVREQVTPYKYIEGKYERIYKGEGKISFICYFPFAKSVFKELSIIQEESNWAISSGLLRSTIYDYFDKYNYNNELDIVAMKEEEISEQIALYFINSGTFKEAVNNHTGAYVFSYDLSDDIPVWRCNNEIIELSNYGLASRENLEIGDKFVIYYSNSGIINIYNGGDLSTGFRLLCKLETPQTLKLEYTPYLGGNSIELIIDPITLLEGDEGFLINSSNGLIQGVRDISYDVASNITYYTTGNIYNQKIKFGYLFQLEPNQSYSDGAQLKITDMEGNIIPNNNYNLIEIFYDYLYF